MENVDIFLTFLTKTNFIEIVEEYLNYMCCRVFIVINLKLYIFRILFQNVDVSFSLSLTFLAAMLVWTSRI